MNIPASALEPFGETGIPTLQLRKDYIRQKVIDIFNATEIFGIVLIEDIRDQLKQLGVIPGPISLNITPDGSGLLLIARFHYPHKSRYHRLITSRKL